MQRIANDDPGAAVTPRETEDGTLVASGLRTLDGEQGLRDAEGVGERNPDTAGAYVEAEQRLRLTGKWYCRHAMMIASEAVSGDYNRLCFD
jgi:hypothetical protein